MQKYTMVYLVYSSFNEEVYHLLIMVQIKSNSRKINTTKCKIFKKSVVNNPIIIRVTNIKCRS